MLAETDASVPQIAAAIAEPARAKMLYCLLDGHARTATELAVVGDVSASTASIHLHRLKSARLVKVLAQGRHRFFRLEGPNVARALEGLSVLAGQSREKFIPSTPAPLRVARTCYDHMAGAVAVALHDRFAALGWLSIGLVRSSAGKSEAAYDIPPRGVRAFSALGLDVEATRLLRRRFAFACLDWSERRPHIGGAIGVALLNFMLKKKWVAQDLDSRVLRVTNLGRHELLARFNVGVPNASPEARR